MALIANSRILSGNPMRYLGSAYGIDNSNSNRAGSIRNFYAGEATVIAGTSIANDQGFPSGNLHPTTWVLPQKSGGIPAALMVSALSGAGDLTSTGILIASTLAALTGNATITSSMVGALAATAALAGNATLSAQLGAISSVIAALTGQSTVAGVIKAKGSLFSDITVTGDLLTTANVADSVWSALSEDGYTYADVVKILTAVAAGKTNISGSDVYFRDLADAKNRVHAAMTGSERTTVTLDPS